MARLAVPLLLLLDSRPAAADQEYVAWHTQTHSNVPPARALAPAVIQHTVHSTAALGRFLWWFGGLDGLTGARNDLWRLDMLSGAWVEQSASGTAPVARRGASLVLAEQRTAYLFGGETAGRARQNDLHALHVSAGSTPSWSNLAPNVTGTVPPARTEHTATIAPLLNTASDPTTAGSGMFIFGGLDSAGRALDDLHELDLTTYAWRALTPGGERPQARKGHAACVILNSLLVRSTPASPPPTPAACRPPPAAAAAAAAAAATS